LGDVTLVTSRAFMNRLVALDNYQRTNDPSKISPMVISGTHALDIVMWMMEAKRPVEIYARSVDKALGPLCKGIDATAGVITFDDGSLYHAAISWALPVVWPGAVYSLEVGITGTEGVLTIDDTHRDIVLATTRSPGGASDFVGRIMQPRLGELLGQPIVVENRAGASGNIGVEAAARSAPDGYTLFLGNIGTIAVNPAVFTMLPVNPLTDLAAVTQVVDVPSVLVANGAFSAGSVKELVALAKASPGKLNYGSPGSGSVNRLEMELLRIAEGLDMVHVPYKGGAGPAVAGLMGGETHVMFTTAASAIGQVRGGKLKLLAVTSPRRMEQAPSAPTMVESGHPDFVTGAW